MPFIINTLGFGFFLKGLFCLDLTCLVKDNNTLELSLTFFLSHLLFSFPQHSCIACEFPLQFLADICSFSDTAEMGIQEPSKRVRAAYLPGKIKYSFVIFCNTNLGWTKRTPLPHRWRSFWLPGLRASSESVLLRMTPFQLWPWERLLMSWGGHGQGWPPAQGSHFQLRLSLVSCLSSAPCCSAAMDMAMSSAELHHPTGCHPGLTLTVA